MRVVGAGLGRTGTASLKLALETLLGEPCYHMYEIFHRPGDVAGWDLAADGKDPDWPRLLKGWGATVDWPASAFYAEQAAAFPDAMVLLSYRDSESWWRSAHATIFNPERRSNDLDAEPRPMAGVMEKIFKTAGVNPSDKASSIEAFERHNNQVRATVPRDRLIEWQPGDGWEPICTKLGIAVPETDFPHSNSTQGFADVVADVRQGRVPRMVPAPPANY